MKINRTAQRTIQIMELISKNRDGLSLNEISEVLEIPKTSAYDIIQTLLQMDMITLKNKNLKEYTTGIKAFEIGSSYIKNTEFLNVVEEPLKDLGDRLNRTVFLGVENHSEVTYLKKYEPQRALITTANLGSKNPMYCTALGKAILSAYSDRKAREIIEEIELTPRTKYTVNNKEELYDELKEIRKKGYAIDNRQLEEHMFCIAAPIYNHENEVVGAISASGLYDSEFDAEQGGREVYETALKISRKLGYMKG